MPLSEFGLIERFFTRQKISHRSTALGIGDDCALLDIPDGYQLAVTADTMVENVHFFAGTDPQALGHKLLAVNLSDLASMGAQPLSVTLALTLPGVDEGWLAQFAQGFLDLAAQFDVDLIGGDTTTGALTLTVQAMGLVPRGQALLRSGAQIGDEIYLSGNVGDAGLGLKILQGYACPHPDSALSRFHRPLPRVATGLAIRQIATACIDLSDGLAGDLGHILKRSGAQLKAKTIDLSGLLNLKGLNPMVPPKNENQLGACLDWEALPLSDDVLAYVQETGDWLLPLVAGDDYELCFTINPKNAALLPPECHKIGVIEAAGGLRIYKDGVIQSIKTKGYEHFS
ncbi:MAG: thiamine-phosphate kinase [Methylovulum sp.]|uniref:thiamine-phosphate kinase n=1 Tax=Methylovulum sp. TaxID=1916980 RepID=UPI0026285999|nr:thiamine-phosphate kinase [Methylovulum sp.]MDD2724206.1 thiamine-phosphate kinase [Methylovulum sp.]MDD5123237.1 thiamine-phosphate kinase [Methylovulum sp.]